MVLLPACVQQAYYFLSINLPSHDRSLASGAADSSLSAIVTSVHASPVFVLRSLYFVFVLLPREAALGSVVKWRGQR